MASALLSTRAVLGDRAVVVAGSGAEAVAGLGALARGESATGVVTGSAGATGKLVWVFPGQGSQWVGMGRELLDASPVFAERITECAAALEPWVDWSLVDVLRGETDPDLMNRVDVLQPASFAVMVGLAAVWASVGVVPDAVVGHSQGEIAAACVAGALSIEDAAKVVALRSQAIAADLSGRGGMASVSLSEQDAVARLAPWAGRVEVAAVNGPSSVVIAGDAEAMSEAVDALGGRRVAVDYASHTRHVEDIRDRLADALAGHHRAGTRGAVPLDRDRRVDHRRRGRGRRVLVPEPAQPGAVRTSRREPPRTRDTASSSRSVRTRCSSSPSRSSSTPPRSTPSSPARCAATTAAHGGC